MRNALIFVLLVCPAFAPFLRAQDLPAASLNPPESSPGALTAELRSLLEQYFAAYQKKDLEAMMAVWSSQSPEAASARQAAARFFEANDNIAVTKLAIGEATLDGVSKARLRASMEVSARNVKSGSAAEGLGKAVHLYDLVNEPGGWKLWREVDAIEDLAAALVATTSEERRTRMLEQNPALATPSLVKALNKLGTNATVHGDLPKALEIFVLTQKLAEKIDDQLGLSTVYRGLGRVYFTQGKLEQALDCIQKGYQIAKVINDPKLLASSLNALGNVQDQLGDYVSALESYRRSLEFAESVHDDQRISSALGNIGIVLQHQGQYSRATEYYLRALQFDRSAGNDPGQVARNLLSLGASADLQGNLSEAVAYYQQAVLLYEKADDPEGLAIVLSNLGGALTNQGNETSALDYYRRSLQISRRVGAKSSIALALANIGTLEKRRANFAAALDNYRQSLRLAQELGEKTRIAALLGHIGEVYASQRNYSRARDWYLNSLSLTRELGAQGQFAQTSADLSLAYYKLGQLDKGVAVAERAAAVSREIGDRYALVSACTNISRAYRALGQSGKARQSLEEAIETLEALRNQVAGGHLQRQAFFEDSVTPYQEMVSLLITQKQASEALAFAERAKGRALLDVLQRGRVKSTKSMTDAERNQERELEVELVSLNSQIQKAEGEPNSDKQRLDSLKAKLDQARIGYEQFQIALYAAHPELKTDRGQVSPITLEQTAGLLRDDRSALLEFSVGEKRSYLFVITRRSGSPTPQMRVYPLHVSASDLTKKAEEFRRTLAARAPDFQVLGKQLYQLLLAPAQKQLAGKDMVIMVPDGPLWSLPFQALVQNDGRYLVEHYAIAYAPSLTVLREMERAHKNLGPAKEPSQTPTLLAMADPVLGQPTLAHASFVYRGEKLGPLPDARREVQALKQFYPGPENEIDVGEEAREDRFKAQAGNFRILHLASHAVLDNASPMYSNILLSPGDSGREDGLLEAREIMQMDLHANLVVLSACETARGHVAPGEGVIGLAWAFFLAGTPTMVVSQWRVESSSTAALMLSFHRFLNTAPGSGNAEVSVARALQKAEIQTLRKPGYRHPFYWAGFVVMGDPGLMTRQ